jgi:hypothetical protein
MKNTILITGVFLIIGMLLAGCTNSNDSGDQNNAAKQDAYAPTGSDQPQDPALQDNGNGQRAGRGMGGPRGGMGAQFIESCGGKAAGDACTIAFGNQSVDGTCADRSGNITCTPNNSSLMQGPGIRGGRNEAFLEACNGKAEGETCTVTMRNQTEEGSCTSRSGNITCVPSNQNLGRRNPQNPVADGQ